jgi:poly(A) polymerase
VSEESDRDPLDVMTGLLGADERAWLVGGAVRDTLLGRERDGVDCDVAVQGDARRLAGSLARAIGGFRFQLSDQFGAWRVVTGDRRDQFDLTPLTGPTIETDLGQRDLTINAMARELRDGRQGDLLDPFGGRSDLETRTLRMVSGESFGADPLRVVRVARFVAELGFSVAAGTLTEARVAAPGLESVAAERVFAELRLMLCADGAVAGLRMLGDLSAADVVLPELEALKGIEQSVYHHLDVYEHTLATLQATIELTRNPALAVLDDEDRERLVAVLAKPLANDMSRGQALRFGALLHDIAKPDTVAVNAEGRVTFMRHDVVGAQRVLEILRRLRASSQLASFVSALTRHHLRLGFLVHAQPLSKRDVYEYLRACEPVSVDVTVLSVGDRLATLGRGSDDAVTAHLELAREIIRPALDWHTRRPASPITGDRLARALNIRPGPQLGAVLAELTEAAYADEVGSEAEAVEYARRWLDADKDADQAPSAKPAAGR